MADECHVYDRHKCALCFECAEVCYSGALAVAGSDITAEQALAEVEKDRVFYEESGGGMTLSGGEPTAQIEFTRAILEGARSASIHTCIETCGFGPADRFAELVPLVELFLWDIKDTDETRHLANTGVPLPPILENLRLVDEAGGTTILRCLLIPVVNLTEYHLDGLAQIYRSLSNCQGIELLAYHPFGDSKRARLGLAASDLACDAPTEEQISRAREYLTDICGIDGVHSSA